MYSSLSLDLTADTYLYSGSFCRSLKITLEDYKKFLEDLAKAKKVELSEIEQKLAGSGAPGIHGASVSSSHLKRNILNELNGTSFCQLWS